jgi:hypothetical protein
MFKKAKLRSQIEVVTDKNQSRNPNMRRTSHAIALGYMSNSIV